MLNLSDVGIGRLQRLIAHYKSLQDNTFWSFFFDNLESERKEILESLGNGLKEGEYMLRYWQGINEAYKKIKTLPDILFKRVEEELNKRDDR